MAKDTGKWILVIAGIFALAYFLDVGGLQDKISSIKTTSTQISKDGIPYISTGATGFSFVGSNALQGGTSVTPTTYVSTNGGAYSSSIVSGTPGDTVDLLFTSTGYHSVFLPGVAVATEPTQNFNVKFYQNGTVTTTIFNNNDDKLYDTAGTGNQTVVSGGTYNMRIRLDGQDKKSTNPMRCILEASNGTAMKSMTLSGLGAVFKNKEKPSSYALNGSDSEVWVYDIDAITGAVSPGGTIGVQSETGMSLADSRFKIDCYTKESFIDTETGDVMVGIEDSQGTLQSLAHYQFTGNFAT